MHAKSSKPMPPHLVILLWAVCLVFSIMAFKSLTETWTILRNADRTTAVCTRVEHRWVRGAKGNNRVIDYHITYQVAGGREFNGVVDAWFSDVGPGKVIEILYDRREPKRVQMNSFLSLWGYPSLFVLISVGMTLGMVKYHLTGRYK
jgi:hypothetical protein